MGIPFDEKELEAVEIRHLKTALLANDVKVFSFPVSPREGFLAQYKKKNIWIPYNVERQMIVPRMIPDNVARGASADYPLKVEEKGGPDMFGVVWEFVPQVNGSMVRPGEPLLNDISEWYEKVVFPDIDSWDWAAAGENYKKLYNYNMARFFTFHNGFWFERLISFMDFENAIVALIDEDQKDDVKALFEKTTDLACRLVDKVCEYFDIDGFYVHDDWGTMLSSFFSPATCAEMIVPYMRRFTDHIHAKGKLADFHSCGKIENQVPNIIAAGWDSWNPMDINDTQMLFEKYGDQLVINVCPNKYDRNNTTEEEQRAAAREFVDFLCVPGKGVSFNNYSMEYLTPAFLEEMYSYSRKRFAEMY